MMRLEADRVAGVGDAGEMVRHRQVYAAVELEITAALAQHDGVERRVGEGLCRYEVVRLAEHLDGRAELRDAAFRQRRGIAAEQQRLMRLGRGVDEDGAGCGKDFWQLLAQFLAQL